MFLYVFRTKGSGRIPLLKEIVEKIQETYARSPQKVHQMFIGDSSDLL